MAGNLTFSAMGMASGRRHTNKTIILICRVNRKCDYFSFAVYQVTRLSHRGRLSIASSVCPVISAAISSASPPNWRARI